MAVFVDGCFWHCCPLHGVKPKSNREFWATKLESNVQRDAETNRKLAAKGWLVLRFWEHQIENEAEECARQIAEAIVRIRAKTRQV